LVISYDDFYELRRRADAYERVQQQALLVQSTLLGLWDPAPDAPRPRGMNGKDWADAFALTFPRCGVPDGLMIGWFANAIQAGYDSAVIRYGHVADRADRLQRRLDLFTAARDALAAIKHDPDHLA
jgi:hypothetical protein